jgi:hypothetical protein
MGKHRTFERKNDVIVAEKQDQSLDLNISKGQMIVNNARKAFANG